MIITHAVVDADGWLKGKADQAKAIGSAGTNVTDYVAVDGSKNIAISADIHDMDGV